MQKRQIADLQQLILLDTHNILYTMISLIAAVFKSTVRIVLMSDTVTTSGRFNLTNITQVVVSGLHAMK
jgi:hypothetical protein